MLLSLTLRAKTHSASNESSGGGSGSLEVRKLGGFLSASFCGDAKCVFNYIRDLRAFKNRILHPPPAVAGSLESARKFSAMGESNPVSEDIPVLHGPCTTHLSPPPEAQVPGERGPNMSTQIQL